MLTVLVLFSSESLVAQSFGVHRTDASNECFWKLKSIRTALMPASARPFAILSLISTTLARPWCVGTHFPLMYVHYGDRARNFRPGAPKRAL